MKRPPAQRLVRLPLVPLRKGQMLVDEFASRRRKRGASPRLFNLDLHIGVIRDLELELHAQGAHLTRWSISGHNGLTRRAFSFPDPVGIVNASTWKRLNADMIERFIDRYSSYLRQFDGFVVTYPPAFAQLFQAIEKPTLVVAATRYEAPYTGRPTEWKAFDEFLRAGIDSRRLHVAANNAGDAEYFRYFVGREVKVVPSVCDYLQPSPTRGNERSVVMGRPGPALDAVLSAGRGHWSSVEQVYGRPHRWGDLASSREVFVIPYNVSTMTLFELATAGTPVAVPGPSLLRELARLDPAVLGELSFFQVHHLSTAGLAVDDPNNFESPSFLDWWIPWADFFDLDLMPNVRIIESLNELNADPVDRRTQVDFRDVWLSRNEDLRRRRHDLITRFLEAL